MPSHHKPQVDELGKGIFRLGTVRAGEYPISFNQFLIDDERPALVHTGPYAAYEQVREAVAQVIDPSRLAYVVLLHWEGDENGGMDRFLSEAPRAQLIGSDLSIILNARGFGVAHAVRGFRDGDVLHLGEHTLRFLETPHVHHWDSMMLFEETTRSLFPSDLFIQPGDQPPVISENLTGPMLQLYREVGIFADEGPVRQVVDRIEKLNPLWIHPMHGGSFTQQLAPHFYRALHGQPFAYCGKILGRPLLS